MDDDYKIDDEDFIPIFIPPIHTLFRHILMRALRDLGEAQEIRRDARLWFEKWENTLPHGVSFRDVCETLGFAESTVEMIKENPYALLDCPMRGKKRLVS